MITITHTATIDVDSKKAWEKISDIGEVYKWHPKVKTSKLESDITRGVGACRSCAFYDGMSVIETVTQWDEGKSITLELTEMSMPLKKAFATLSVKPQDQKSVIAITMDIEPKFGPIGWLMAQVMIKPMMRSMFKQLTFSLEQHVKTGQNIGKNGSLLEVA